MFDLQETRVASPSVRHECDAAEVPSPMVACAMVMAESWLFLIITANAVKKERGKWGKKLRGCVFFS